MSTEVIMSPDERRVLLAVIFYDGSKDHLQFEIADGLDREEAVAILKRYFPKSPFEQDGVKL